MLHLMSERVDVYRQQNAPQDGAPVYQWVRIYQALPCRFDLVFVRLGKDALALAPSIEAGRQPDRMGILFWQNSAVLVIGDRLDIVDQAGVYTLSGMFEVTSVPDPVPGLRGIHHWEIPVKEVAQAVAGPMV